MKAKKSGPRLAAVVGTDDAKRPGAMGRGGASPVHPFDRARGTDTGGLIPRAELATGHPNDKHVTAYYGVAPSILRGLIELWLNETRPPAQIDRYTFVDIGAGKGRALLVAAESPFYEVVGVELNPELAAVAERNIARVRALVGTEWGSRAAEVSGPRATLGQDSGDEDPSVRDSEASGVEGRLPDLPASIRLLTGDALTIPMPGTPTLLHLFHPFEAPALRRLLRNIEREFGGRPGALDLLYVNAEHAAVLDAHPAFTRLWSGPVPMSTEDHMADLQEISGQLEYGSTGDEQCAIYRYVGRGR